MLVKLINKIPRDWLVFMYKHTPFTRLKNALVYRAQHKFIFNCCAGHFHERCRGSAAIKARIPEATVGNSRRLDGARAAGNRLTARSPGRNWAGGRDHLIGASPVWPVAEPRGSYFYRPGYPGYLSTKR